MEIEVKLKYTNKSAIIKWLNNNGFKLNKTVSLTDYYFGQNHKSMNDINDLYRIRKSNNNIELTLKTKISGNKITKRNEINVKINDVTAAKKILTNLGCKLIKTNVSKKEIWQKDKTIFEFIKNIKPQKIHFIEVEASSEKAIREIILSLNKYVKPIGEEIFSK